MSTTRIGGSSIFSSSTAQLGGTKTVFVVDALTERVWRIGRCGLRGAISLIFERERHTVKVAHDDDVGVDRPHV